CVGATRLPLPPGLAAAARAVERRGVFHDDALMAGAERLLEHALSLGGIGREDARDLEVRRDRRQPRGALLERRVEEVLAVDVEHIEEERGDALRRRVAVDLRDRVLEGGRA